MMPLHAMSASAMVCLGMACSGPDPVPLALQSTAITWAPAREEIQCPAPGTIESIAVPSSFNAVYFAVTTNGPPFSGYDLAGIQVDTLHLVKAFVLSQGGVWRLYCDYEGSSLQRLSLATAGAARYATCTFRDQGLECEDARESCVFLCPAM